MKTSSFIGLAVPVLLIAAVAGADPATTAAPSPAWNQPLDAAHQARHVLNRLAFGPRPGDVEAVEQMGVNAWIQAQLTPSGIDDSAVEQKSLGFKTLQLGPQQLLLAYAGDTAKFLKKLKQDQLQQQGAAGQAAPATVQNTDATVTNAAPNGTAGATGDTMTPQQQRLMDAVEASGMEPNTSVQAVGELAADKIMRAVESKRQLQEVLVDFWSNHFNVDVKKGPDRAYEVYDVNNVIRPRVFGTFRDLLGADAKSPSMLWYLDNARSTKQFTLRNGKTIGGVNENYGREIMELHTLGVNGGYTQNDVQEVARCFTGWGIRRPGGRQYATGKAPALTGDFYFNPLAHDQGQKTVLGVTIPADGGQQDGETVLDLLANSPATAQHLSFELCERFVSDTPPPALVARVAKVFLQSHGDLPTVYRAIFFSPEFMSKGAYDAKIKSPFEYVVSSVRALGGTYAMPDSSLPGGRLRLVAMGGNLLGRGAQPRRPAMVSEISAMGEPLFSCVPPTGYPEDSRTWVSSSALIARLNFSLALTSGRVGDALITGDTYQDTSIDDAATELVGDDLTPSTRNVLEQEMQNTPGDGARLRALLLGSPEFQRR